MAKYSIVTNRRTFRFAVAVAVALVPQASFASSMEKVLYRFPGGSGGTYPEAGLAMDKSGNFYGTTESGGYTNCAFGCGIIFEIGKHGKVRTVHAFLGGENDGAYPDGGLIADGAGNFYGVTGAGGPNDAGTVFKLAPGGKESIVYAFKGGADGNGPIGTLALDGNGNLYGTTSAGGNIEPCGNPGCGTVFEVTPDGTETVLYAFQGGADGEVPVSGLIIDSGGNLYGTTPVGGGNGCESVDGCGPRSWLHLAARR